MPTLDLTDEIQATAAALEALVGTYEAHKTTANKQAIAKYIKSISSDKLAGHHYQLAILLDHHPQLIDYCRWPELEEHWETQLTQYGAPDHFLPQKPMLNTLDVVLGIACHFRFVATVDTNEDEAAILLRMAVGWKNLSSIHEQHKLIKQTARKTLVAQEQKPIQQELVRQLLSEHKIGQLHGTPGWLILAQAYLNIAALDYDAPDAITNFHKAQACIEMAKEAEHISQAAIRNSTFGNDLGAILSILFTPTPDRVVNTWELLDARLLKLQPPDPSLKKEKTFPGITMRAGWR